MISCEKSRLLRQGQRRTERPGTAAARPTAAALTAVLESYFLHRGVARHHPLVLGGMCKGADIICTAGHARQASRRPVGQRPLLHDDLRLCPACWQASGGIIAMSGTSGQRWGSMHTCGRLIGPGPRETSRQEGKEENGLVGSHDGGLLTKAETSPLQITGVLTSAFWELSSKP